MDPLTQGLLGAGVAQSVAGEEEVRRSTSIGFIAGMLADADVFIVSAKDPLLGIEYHRHFTHSLIFIPIGGLIASTILWPLLRHRFSFKRICFLATVSYATGGLLDACTAYGTRLLWPFSDLRVAWNVISVIDPVFTTALGVAVLLSLFKNRPSFARLGLLFVTLYLLAGLFQRERAEHIHDVEARNRGHTTQRTFVMPSIGNILLWRTIYQSGDAYYVDAIRVSPFTKFKIYEGGSIKRFTEEEALPDLSRDSTLFRDIQRFSHFADKYTTLHPDRDDVIGDLRYSYLPNNLSPLWGIEIDPQTPDRHVRYHNFGEMNKVRLRTFLDMIHGRDLP